MLLLGLWTFLLSVLGHRNVPDTSAVHIKGVAPVFWVQQSCDSFVLICDKGQKAATAKHMSLSHHYLKRFSVFHLLSLLGVFTLVHENIQSILPGQWENPKFSFSFHFFFFPLVSFSQA